MRTISAIFAFLAAFTACAPQKPAVVTKSEPQKIRRIAVKPFEGQGGATLTHEFVRQLVAAGVQVSQNEDDADGVVSGRMIDYRGSGKLIVYLGNGTAVLSSGQTLTVTNPVLSVGGASVAPPASVGMPAVQVVASVATAAVAAKLVAHGQKVWADQFGYESFEIGDAAQTAVSVLVRSLQRALPAEASQ